jgi:phosphoadenosine phosphosulfate reductase
VEPAQRAYQELGVRSVITGRRASQGSARAKLQPLEIDSTGLFKLNPFAGWSFSQVKAYIDEHNVPRNALLDKGYKSVGDWHSTVPVSETAGANSDENERAGRWKGKNKTECGLHKDYFKMKMAAKKKVRLTMPMNLKHVSDSSPTFSSVKKSCNRVTRRDLRGYHWILLC